MGSITMEQIANTVICPYCGRENTVSLTGRDYVRVEPCKECGRYFEVPKYGNEGIPLARWE